MNMDNSMEIYCLPFRQSFYGYRVLLSVDMELQTLLVYTVTRGSVTERRLSPIALPSPFTEGPSAQTLTKARYKYVQTWVLGWCDP